MQTATNAGLGLFRLLAVWCVCMSLALAGCAGANKKEAGKSPQELERLADESANQGNPQAAMAMYAAALDAGAAKAPIKLKMARISFSQADYAQALLGFEEVLAQSPDDSEALWGAGYSLFSLGQFDEAEIKLTALTVKQPDLAQAFNLLGIIANLKKQSAKALPALRRARELDPTDPDIANNLGLAQFMAGRYAEAVGSFRFALRQKPQPKTSNNLGLALCRLGRIDEAFEAFKTASGEAVAYNNTGVCLEEAGKREAALEYYEKAVASSPRYFASADTNATRLRASLGGLGEAQVSLTPIPAAAGAANPAGRIQAQGFVQDSILGAPIPVDEPKPHAQAVAKPVRPDTATKPTTAEQPSQPRQPVPFEAAPSAQTASPALLAPEHAAPQPVLPAAIKAADTQTTGANLKKARVTGLTQETVPAGLLVHINIQGPNPAVSSFFRGTPAALIVDIDGDATMRLPQPLSLTGPIASKASLTKGPRGLRLTVELHTTGPVLPDFEIDQIPGDTKILIKNP